MTIINFIPLRDKLVIGGGSTKFSIGPSGGRNRATDGFYRIDAAQVGFNVNPSDRFDFLNLVRITSAVTPQLKFRDLNGSESISHWRLGKIAGDGFDIDQNNGTNFSSFLRMFIVEQQTGNIAFNFSTFAPTFGGGSGVINLRRANSIPSANPVDGIFVYETSNSIIVRKPDGTLVTVAPFTSGDVATDKQTTTVTLSDTTPDILLTLPSLSTGGIAVFVMATLEFENASGGARTVDLRLFRDGTELSSTDRWLYRLDTADNDHTVTIHWVDSSPSGSHVYTIRAISSGTNTNAKVNRRAFAFV